MDSVRNHLTLVPYADSRNLVETAACYEEENEQAHIKSVVDSSLRAHFSDSKFFRKYWMGDIVVLVGTSTAGKTSIIRALQTLESDRKEDGGDLRILAQDVRNYQVTCPEETEVLLRAFKEPLDVSRAVFSKERAWRTGISHQEKELAEEAISKIRQHGEKLSSEEQAKFRESFENLELQMFDDAFEHSRRGGSVIFDVLKIDKLAQHLHMRKFGGPIRIVLVYCPFYELSARMQKRNQEAQESGEYSNQRVGEFPLVQFSEIYTQKKGMQPTFELITREQALTAFNDNFERGVEFSRREGHPMPSEEDLLFDKRKFQAQFMENLGFKEGVDVIEVAPKDYDNYDLILNSKTLAVGESARVISSGTWQRK